MLEKLRKAMKSADIDMLLIPSADPHGSEYPEEYFKARKHFSGFTGSAGTLLIWQGGAGLWTDGRYFIQAERQLEGSGIDLFKMREPGVPTVDEFIAENIKGGVLGADLRTISASEGMELEKGGAILKDCRSLIDGCWEGRPELSREPAYVLPMELAGVSAGDKLAAVRAEMAKCDANACIFTDLADIAWLFNIRGNDVKYLPVALSYAIVEKQKAYVFMDAAKGQYGLFFEEAIGLLKPGGVLLCDNVLQDGDVLESRFAVTRRNRTIHSRMREYLYALKHNAGLETAILNIGDGMSLSIKKNEKW